MKQLIILVGPPGAGKSTLAEQIAAKEAGNFWYVNQDSQGKDGHKKQFEQALKFNSDIIIDRMNFNKEQRARYLNPAKELGYKTKIIVLHESYDTCLERMKNREGHPTIKDEETAKKALHTFFTKYERPANYEADVIEFVYPSGEKPLAIWVDMDNTLSNASHREHFLKGPKKDWNSFFEACKNDPINRWCADIIHAMNLLKRKILICSARPSQYELHTRLWLEQYGIPYDQIIMRHKNDFRQDFIVKEIMLDFEIKTKYDLIFSIDDRKQVIDKIRERGIVVLDCAGEKGNF